ncbi:MAG: MotA/TolQ/ExbB proton channel family protein [Bacillota bacterium]
MRYYSKFRLALFAVLLAVAAFAASTGYAQSGTTPATPTTPAANEAQTHKGAQSGVFAIIWQNKDPVFATILILSIVGVALIIQGFIKARRSVMLPATSTNYIRDLISQKQFKELLDFTETDPSFVSRALNPAFKRAPSFQAMKEALETAIGEQTADQFRRIEYLNIIGNLGPLLGLLGTVLGMIDSFQAMSESGGQADPKVLAAGISKALAHTFLGLMLALPCLASFGVLRTLIDRLTVQGALLAEELLLMTKPQEMKPAAAAAVATRPGVIPPPPMPVSAVPASAPRSPQA